MPYMLHTNPPLLRNAMDVFALKLYGGNDGSDDKHNLSLVSHTDFSVCGNVDLPFDQGEAVSGGACGGLVYFQSVDGRIVVSDLYIRKWKVFDLPDCIPRSDLVALQGSGLGYDATSRDYKLIRYYVQYHRDEESDGGYNNYRGYTEYMELYSFNTGSWRSITKPDASITRPCAVYVGGSCYWTACLGPKFGGSKDNPCRDDILSFDCATNTFDHLSFPETRTGKHCWSRVVEYCGLLGALVYWGPDVDDFTCSSPLKIKVFVLRETSWCHLYSLTCDNVERPLGFGESKDGPMLFLEGKYNGETNQLLVYNLGSGELKGLGIYDLRSHMIPISFSFGGEKSPPGLEPIPFGESLLPSPSVDEEERNMVSKNRPRMKTKSGRRKKTVFEVFFSKHSVKALKIEEA